VNWREVRVQRLDGLLCRYLTGCVHAAAARCALCDQAAALLKPPTPWDKRSAHWRDRRIAELERLLAYYLDAHDRAHPARHCPCRLCATTTIALQADPLELAGAALDDRAEGFA
jgi:hypothetical protein